jgi:hypothetical protein
MYPKCDEIKCKWHMGFGYDKHPYLNGACHNSGGKESMFCPLNEDSVLNKEKCECQQKPLLSSINNVKRCQRCYGKIN